MLEGGGRGLLSLIFKPRLRGVLHQYSFFVSVVGGLVLVLAASSGLAQIASAVYAAALAGLFGVSALYHRLSWRPRAHGWMRRLDHAMIFLLIAGTYTPMALLALPGTVGPLLLTIVWAATIAGIVFSLVWITAPRWVSVVLYVLLGWLAVVALPDLVGHVSLTTLLLFGLGGMVYSAGALVYATGRPDPAPTVFGYHEVFHALTIAAAAMHFAAVASVVLPSTTTT
jgi:hemolysin III